MNTRGGENDNTVITYNIGISILRTVMCFCVVLCHFWTDEDYPVILEPFRMIRECAVPVFMMISFMLVQRQFVRKENVLIKKRLCRLIVPQLGWAVIYWVVYEYIFEPLCNINITNGIQDLIWQIFTGHSANINPSMWFQTILIVLSIIFFLIFKFIPQRAGIACIYILSAIALISQYSKINYDMFIGLRYELRYPLGRIAEMLPYAAAGFGISYYRLYDNGHKNIVVFISIIAAAVLVYSPFLPAAYGFGYAGITSIFAAFLLITVTMIIPFNNLLNSKIKIIYILSKYTMGIYCVHRLVGYICIYIFNLFEIRSGTFGFCVLTYCLSYVLSAIIAMLPLKICRKLVE